MILVSWRQLSVNPQVRPTAASLEALRKALPPFSPGVAASAEMDEFCRYYGLDFEQRIEGVEHSTGAVKSGGYILAVHSYVQLGATSNLLLVHGYLDHSGLFGSLIEYGLKQACNVLVFDLPGHGLSTGEPAAIDDFQDYSRAIKAVLDSAQLPGLPLWTMAQSTGCAALMEFSRMYEWPFVSTVFLAPLIRPKNWHTVLLAYFVLRPFIEGTKRGFSENSSNKEFLAFVRQDPLQSHKISIRWVGALRRWLASLIMTDLGIGPVLVLQGDADETVAWQSNMKELSKLVPQCQIVYIEGGGHHLANESERIRRDYLQKVDSFRTREPGGE